MVTPCLAGTFATLQIGIFLDHVFPILVLPLSELLLLPKISLAHSLLSSVSGTKQRVHMGRFLVQMHHSGYNCFGSLVLLDELQRFIEELF